MPGTWKALLSAAAVLVGALVGRAGVLADEPVDRSVAVAGFARQDLPEGAGKEVVERLCTGCHDLMFTVSTREDEDGWTRIVNDMRSRGTDGTEEEFAQVIEYLAAHMGTPAAAASHAAVEIVANRTKVAPGERFALGVRLVAAEGWRLKGAADSASLPQIACTTPQAVHLGKPAPPAGEGAAAWTVFSAEVATSVAPGTTLDFTAHVTYEVCREETCLKETTAVSMSLPVGEGGQPDHLDAFAPAH